MTTWYRRLCALAVILTVPLWTAAGCSSGGDCSPCTSDKDCNPGETCDTFVDDSGNTQQMCADPSTQTCTETTYS